MKAVVVEKYIQNIDEVTALIRETPSPVPDFDKDEVLVEIYVTALNFFDIIQMQGKYQTQPPFPWVAGMQLFCNERPGKIILVAEQFSGVIKQASSKSPLPVGTRVCGSWQGSFAQHVVVPWQSLIKLPDSISFEQGSGIYVTYPTAYAGLTLRGKVKAGDWVLVHAAAGGVGLSSCQIAKALGAKVIACATANVHSICLEHGLADYAVDSDKDWAQEVKRITSGHGADVVIDPLGMINKSLKCIAWDGRIVVVGFVAGTIEKVPANIVLLKNCSITGLFWGAHKINQPDAIPQVWEQVMDLFAQRKLHTVVYERKYNGLEMLQQALQDMWDRKSWGKSIVRIRETGKL